ncbi:uncharacterized protein LOC118648862 isoform X1 [Monomorium pharaonis]|uniref:uncharacterized protein LOC118648862 isoform X1 n=1 Tax=Monomorium pharaonis TaxID=307658 RepID=UPI0017463BAC|nr:uncharacterized protein LOC118648862 isoform X1 [Monomorium pharaonis]XP_036151232.1 uncharacterized protein LOC118648862 isoform X1 [Monomorium pharaonis]
MKRTMRNIKQPTRFADMVPFDTSSSENEPPINRRRLLNDSGSIKDDIEQLKSTLTTCSKKERPKQDKHVRNTFTSKHSFSQPLLKKNTFSHKKFPLTNKSFSQENHSLIPHSPSVCAVNVESRNQRSVHPHSSPNRTTHVYRNCSVTPQSPSSNTAHVDSRSKRSLSPQLLLDHITHIDSDSNHSVTSHSPLNHTTYVDVHRNRSVTPHSPSDHTAHVDSRSKRSLSPQLLPDHITHIDSESNHSVTSHSSPNHTTYVDVYRNRSVTPHSPSGHTVHVDSHSKRFLSPHSSPNRITQIDYHTNRSVTPHSSPARTSQLDSHSNRSLNSHSSQDRIAQIDSQSSCSETQQLSTNRIAHAESHINRSPSLLFVQRKYQTSHYYSNKHSTHSSVQTKHISDLDSHHNHKRSICHDKFSAHDHQLCGSDLKTCIHKNTNNISRPLQCTISSKNSLNDDLSLIRSDIWYEEYISLKIHIHTYCNRRSRATANFASAPGRGPEPPGCRGDYLREISRRHTKLGARYVKRTTLCEPTRKQMLQYLNLGKDGRTLGDRGVSGSEIQLLSPQMAEGEVGCGRMESGRRENYIHDTNVTEKVTVVFDRKNYSR